MTSKALVGPLPTIRFQDGSRVAYEPPLDTGDDRYRACRSHHPACDCREALLGEQFAEYRGERTDFWRAAARELRGHRLYDYGPLFDGPRVELDDPLYWRYLGGDGPLACQCTGCRIARAGHVSIWTDKNGIVTDDAESHIR